MRRTVNGHPGAPCVGTLASVIVFSGLGDALRKIVEELPFAAIYSTPLRISIGELKLDAWVPAMAVHVMWIVFFGTIAALF